MNERQKADRRKERMVGRLRKGALDVVDGRRRLVAAAYLTERERRAAIGELEHVENGLTGVFEAHKWA